MTIPNEKIALIGFPFDEYSSFLKGTAEAPPLIRRAFRSAAVNTWSESGINLGEPGIITDFGDMKPEPEVDYFQEIESATGRLLEKDFRPFALGGDHSITYPVIRAIRKKFHQLDILHFDAHPDLYNEFRGNRLSHACPFARIMEEGLAKRLVQVGIRTLNGHQREQAARFGVEVLEMKDWRENRRLVFNRPLYISFDMDVLDPAFAPGVSHPEPGGFTTRQVINAVARLQASEIAGADIVEYNPRRDPLGITAAAAAKVFKEITARIVAGSR